MSDNEEIKKIKKEIHNNADECFIKATLTHDNKLFNKYMKKDIKLKKRLKIIRGY